MNASQVMNEGSGMRSADLIYKNAEFSTNLTRE